ncbi:hypothetical protein OB905_10415 [Halobacteria archaeon AArc-dxtr1]|nr:hypothetical protein [Halobacteria archaeon AArc-dxtr1]
MSQPDDRPTDTPTTDAEEARDEGTWMVRNWLAVAVVSILTLLLLAVVMMQWTGLVDVGAPLADTEGGQWIVVGALALAVLLIAGWSWRAMI